MGDAKKEMGVAAGAAPFDPVAEARMSFLPVHSGDGYSYGGGVVVTVGKKAILLGEGTEAEVLGHHICGAFAARAAAPDLAKALSELLDAFECEPDDLMPHEYEAIVTDAKKRARAALSKAGV